MHLLLMGEKLILSYSMHISHLKHSVVAFLNHCLAYTESVSISISEKVTSDMSLSGHLSGTSHLSTLVVRQYLHWGTYPIL